MRKALGVLELGVQPYLWVFRPQFAPPQLHDGLHCARQRCDRRTHGFGTVLRGTDVAYTLAGSRPADRDSASMPAAGNLFGPG
jgi:hypothetical protein